ncbi:putative nuclease HARBI1 [Pleurodeles waltl]|uniref:putative nuclease HARBI1 n=1 Tax=Pleurodeles waltl TaxID=8319 RepID=UPI0037095D5D
MKQHTRRRTKHSARASRNRRSHAHKKMRHSARKDFCRGDSAYALRPWILTPYLTPGKENERRYNSAHRWTRTVIERTFGLLKARFKYLHKSRGALQYAPETSFKIVGACAILHNIATRRGLHLMPEDTDSEDEDQELPHRQTGDRSIANQGRQRRDHIATQYFGRR